MDASTKFMIQYGAGRTIKIYHQLTKRCICKGPVNSSKQLEVVAKDSCDPDQCAIKLTNIHDLDDWLIDVLEFYFELDTEEMRSEP